MKGFAQLDGGKAKVHWRNFQGIASEHKAKNQQIFMLCPEWAEAESEVFDLQSLFYLEQLLVSFLENFLYFLLFGRGELGEDHFDDEFITLFI